MELISVNINLACLIQKIILNGFIESFVFV